MYDRRKKKKALEGTNPAVNCVSVRDNFAFVYMICVSGRADNIRKHYAVLPQLFSPERSFCFMVGIIRSTPPPPGQAMSQKSSFRLAGLQLSIVNAEGRRGRGITLGDASRGK